MSEVFFLNESCKIERNITRDEAEIFCILTKNDEEVAVDFDYKVARGASLKLRVLTYAKAASKITTNFRCQHQAEAKSSYSSFAILEEDCVRNNRNTLIFDNDANNAIGTERDECLLLGEHIANISVPEIICDNPTAQSEHYFYSEAPTSLEIDYLKTRGLDSDAAVRIITKSKIRNFLTGVDEAVITKIEEEL